MNINYTTLPILVAAFEAVDYSEFIPEEVVIKDDVDLALELLIEEELLIDAEVRAYNMKARNDHTPTKADNDSWV